MMSAPNRLQGAPWDVTDTEGTLRGSELCASDSGNW
jgi:hypothetical protein